jgi:selenide,water dikinase
VDETGQLLLTDAQTSGGLLLCVAEENLEETLKVLRDAFTPSAAVIGRIVARKRRRSLICMTE